MKRKVADCARRAVDGDRVYVHYRGTLTDGEQFDASCACLTAAAARHRNCHAFCAANAACSARRSRAAPHGRAAGCHDAPTRAASEAVRCALAPAADRVACRRRLRCAFQTTAERPSTLCSARAASSRAGTSASAACAPARCASCRCGCAGGMRLRKHGPRRRDTHPRAAVTRAAAMMRPTGAVCAAAVARWSARLRAGPCGIAPALATRAIFSHAAFRSCRAQIPSDLGYGANGSPPKIPGGATLIFQARSLLLTPLQSPALPVRMMLTWRRTGRWSCCPSASRPRRSCRRALEAAAADERALRWRSMRRCGGAVALARWPRARRRGVHPRTTHHDYDVTTRRRQCDSWRCTACALQQDAALLPRICALHCGERAARLLRRVACGWRACDAPRARAQKKRQGTGSLQRFPACRPGRPPRRTARAGTRRRLLLAP